MEKIEKRVYIQDVQYNKFHQYDYMDRWVSYWHQIDEVLKMHSQKVLEIGAGNKTVANYLKGQNVDVTVLDVNSKLKPDVVGSVLDMPFEDNYFDVVLCAEVLEHIPFDKFENGLQEISRVGKIGAVLSLSHFGPAIILSFKIPFIKQFKWAQKIPYHPTHKSKYQFVGGHQWEIGKKNYNIRSIRDIINKYFLIKNEFIPWENQYHHFFILKDRNKQQ